MDNRELTALKLLLIFVMNLIPSPFYVRSSGIPQRTRTSTAAKPPTIARRRQPVAELARRTDAMAPNSPVRTKRAASC